MQIVAASLCRSGRLRDDKGRMGNQNKLGREINCDPNKWLVAGFRRLQGVVAKTAEYPMQFQSIEDCKQLADLESRIQSLQDRLHRYHCRIIYHWPQNSYSTAVGSSSTSNVSVNDFCRGDSVGHLSLTRPACVWEGGSSSEA